VRSSDGAISFDEYAALARQLHDLQRSGERNAAQAARRRDATAAGVHQLGQRLAIQQQRLHQLARAIGQPPPGLAPAPRLAKPPGPGPAPAPPPLSPAPGPPPPARALPAAGADQPALLAGPDQQALPPGPTRLALPATPASPAGPQAAGGTVPAQRTAPVDPVSALESARQAADAADAAALRAETMAQQPALLPGWSPLARAAAVYAGCALVAVILQYALVLAANADAVDTISLFAWMCAGLPAMAFFAGYLVLTGWGKPRIVVGTPARYARLGFAICFVAMPVAYCGYELLIRMS
jgi:hypothetical protein